MSATDTPDTTLLLNHVFKASPTQVYAAFSEPEILKKWWAPKGFVITDVQLNATEAGATRYTMLNESTGDRYVWDIVQLNHVHDSLLQWKSTWIDGFPDNRATRATVEFRAIDKGTEVSLTHEFLPDAETRDGHGEGWKGGFEKLDALLHEA